MKNVLLVGVVFLFCLSCATPGKNMEVQEGITIQTNQPREKVMEVIVQVLTEEGYSIDVINDKYGIINCKPLKILEGNLMKKTKTPGPAEFQNMLEHYFESEFSPVISADGIVKLKSIVTTELGSLWSPPGRKHIDVPYSIKLNEYYSQMIKERLGNLKE